MQMISVVAAVAQQHSPRVICPAARDTRPIYKVAVHGFLGDES